ncbi:T9SS type A sorting domain-containing protein [Epilithonimonas hominis]|uniref:T9SS type A sorting domain-containing protein n=1 Tax=Epilithonimonas hominis TaxID=420404 RepID=UPI0028A060EA|nr:T9SS type A sorting domain-containing protein [Epilithonimonas hominis]
MKNYLFSNRRIIFGFFLLFVTFFLYGQVSITSLPYSKSDNFNTPYNPNSLANANATIPAGWTFSSSATAAYRGITASPGTSGGYYGFSNTTDSSLGALRTGAVGNITYTVSFVNNSGSTITALSIAWNYEQWTFNNTSGWDVTGTGQLATNTTLNAADFAGTTTGTAGASTPRSLSLTGLSIANGQSFGITWVTTDPTGGDNAVSIDDFSITASATASSYSGVTAGSGTEPTTISSLITTQGASVLNFDFLVTDDANTSGGNDSLPTLINQIVIPQGTGNDIADWTQAIAGAELSDGTNTIAGTVNTINITFSGINTATLGSVSDNGTKNYTLKVWLKSTMGGTLPTTADGLNLAFKIDRSNFTTASSATSTQFESGTGTLVESGATNNEITVVATKLNFVQQPSNTAVNVSMTPAVTVSADDANGNRDLNFGSTVSVTSTGTLTGSPVAVSASSGLATFSALQHTALGTALKLTAATSGFANVDSSTFNIILVTTATDSFRSNVSTGTWAAAGSWESSSDGSNWITATAAPTSAANTITIRNGHNITLSSNVAVDQLVIENGGQLTVDQTTGVLNINDGSGFDIDIKSGGVLQVINSGTTFSYSQTVIFASNASMNVSGKVMVGNGSSTMGGGYGEFGFAAASQIIWNHNAILEWNTTGSVPATSGQTYFPGLSAATVPIFRISAISGSNLGGGSDTVINGLFQLNGTTVNWGGTGSKIFRNGVVAIGSGSMVRNASTGSWQIGDTTVAGDAEIGGSSGSLTLNNPSGISVSSVCSATLTSNATLTAGTFTNNGVLNLGTYVLSGTAGFSAALSSTLITANTGGLVSAIAVSGTKTFVAGANYVFNASTTTPFPTGTFGNPASLTFNNADVTSNRTTTLTVTGAVNINGTSKFALNSVAGNDLALGGVMTIGANASFDSNGENQINNAGGSVVVNGTFITKDAQGFSGTNATIPTITNITLNTGSTIQYALDGAQAISSRTDYKNLLFTGNGTKSSNNSITPIAGTVTVNGVNTILDVSNNTFGDSGTSLTMTAGTFRLGGSGVKPDISGSYSLSAGTTIEFTGTSATQVRLAPQYANVVISGTNVVAGTTTNGGLTFRAGGNFTVKTGARFKVNNDNGFSGGTTTAIKNTNSPVITLETGSTIDYMGSDQIITNALPYQNLTVSTLGTKTSASGDLIVNNLTTVSAGTLKFLKTADNATPNVLYAHKGINSVGGTVIFENNALLMQDDDANNLQATIQSQRDVVDMNNISTQMDYVYWSSPVAGQNIKSFSPNTPANGYLQYNESNDKFSVTSDPNFQIGKGYAIRAETGTNGYNKSYVFTGIPHNSSLDSPNLKWTDSNHGYNLVGNPYPSNINFDALFANNSSKIYSTAWFWTNNSYTAAQLGSSYNGNNYAVYNGTGGSPATYNPASPYTGSAIPNGIVKVGQAFIVQAKSGGMNQPIGFTNTMRTTSGGNFFQKQGAKNRFWLTMTSPNTLVNTILVGYITGASNDFETDFDGELFVVGSDSFYSLLGAKKLAIQGKADVFSADDVVSIGNVYSTDGSYSINLQDAEGLFDGSQKIYLRDKLLNKYIDMTSDHSYQFTAVKGTDNTRFEIVYKDKSVLGSDSAVKSNFIVYKDGNEQVVKSDKKLGRIELFDASGKLIRSYVATSNEFRIDTSTLMNALYIIKINNSGEIRTKKFIK